MRFIYPIGLLGLIAIPVLVLIYIILNKYTEQTVTSTYLWTLSEKFLKRRNPISKIANIVSLILQILAVTLISLAIAHPMIIIPNSASSYCFVLDGSGSMNMTQNGKSRFDVAKDDINRIIDKSMNGSKYTLILSGYSAQTIYAGLDDKNLAKEILNSQTCAHASKPLSDAMNLAQRYFDENPSLITYVITDKLLEEAPNIKIIDVGTDVENYAVTDAEYNFVSGIVEVTGKAISYRSDCTLTIELYIDGAEEPYKTQELDVIGLEEKPFRFECNVVDFQSIKVVVVEEDALSLDNEIILYNVRYENISDTLLVSDEPFYMRAALAAAGNTQVEIVSIEEFEADNTHITGYGLYIFDNYMPASLPSDGAVWFINPQGNLAGTNFSFQGVTVPRQLAKYSTSTSTFVRSMLSGITQSEFQLAKFSKYGLSGRFNTIATCEGSPVVFTGTNNNGFHQVVIGFDLKDSAQFTLFSDFTSLTINLLNYSFPDLIEKTSYYSGEIMQINVIAGCESVIVTSPQGRKTYYDAITDVCEYEVTETGVYTVTAVLKNQPDRVFSAYASLPVEERTPYAEGEFIELLGTQGKRKTNGVYDTLLIIFIILAVTAVADYGVYCYEQYQLR